MNELYPLLNNDEQIPDIIREIVRIRNNDLDDWNNLPSQFVQGRGLFTTRAAPSSATDVLATDQEGDICNDATYEYKLLTISGVLKWDRRTLSVGW